MGETFLWGLLLHLPPSQRWHPLDPPQTCCMQKTSHSCTKASSQPNEKCGEAPGGGPGCTGARSTLQSIQSGSLSAPRGNRKITQKEPPKTDVHTCWIKIICLTKYNHRQARRQGPRHCRLSSAQFAQQCMRATSESAQTGCPLLDTYLLDIKHRAA